MSESQRIPESMGPREIGAYMAELRARFNLTQLEVSERLHIRTRYVVAIEEGRFDLMPGKVYARGYIHTYAEFLGLDADQVTAQCFANDNTIQPAAPSAPSLRTISRAAEPRNWQGLGVMAVVALVVLLVLTQLTGGEDDAPVTAAAESTVAPVPEALLQTIRTLVMPTPQNYECLTGNGILTCFHADNTSRALNRLYNDPQLRFTGDIDTTVAEPEVAEEVAEDAPTAAEEEAPAAPEPEPEAKKPEKPAKKEARKPAPKAEAKPKPLTVKVEDPAPAEAEVLPAPEPVDE